MSDQSVLRGRLDRLERSNRRMKMIGVAVFALIAMGSSGEESKVPPVIRAQRFQVVDQKGKVLADLGPFNGKFQATDLLIYDNKSVLRASLGIDAATNNSVFASWDPSGVIRTSSGVVPLGPMGGLSGHFVYDQNGFARTGVDVDPVNNFIGFFDLDTKNIARAIFGTNLDASVPGFNLYDANATLRVFLGVDFDSTGGTGFFLADKNNVVREGLSIDTSDHGAIGSESLFFRNPANQQVGNFNSLAGGGGTYSTFDASGTQTGHLP